MEKKCIKYVYLYYLQNKAQKQLKTANIWGVKKTLPTYQIQVVKVLLKYAQI